MGGDTMATPGLADKMYRRTRDAPMSRRHSIDLLYIMQRHAVFTIDQDSADHISNIIFAQQSVDDLDHIKKFELMNEFHSDYDPRRGKKPRAAPKLRAAIDDARVKWAEILRDENLVDVRIITLPSEVEDFEHIDPPVDVTGPPFGNQLQRFQGLKRLLVEEGGGMPYRLKPRFGNNVTMELDLVIGKNAFERIATPYSQTVLNFRTHTITAPAAPINIQPIDSDKDHKTENKISADLSLENLVRVFRQRKSTLQQAVLRAPKQPWNYPFSAGGGRRHSQPEWSGDDRPFSKEIFDPRSNSEWIQKDFAMRAAQIEEWATARQAREALLSTNVPDENFTPMMGLARCETYTADRSMEWYNENLAGSVEHDYNAALRATNMETVNYHHAVANHKAMVAQTPQNRAMIEYYRQTMEGQACVVERAKHLQETIAQGLPPAPPRRKKWDMPIRESHKLSQMDRPQPGTEMDMDEEPSGPSMAPGKAKEPSKVSNAQGKAADTSPFVRAEPGHTPIPAPNKDFRSYGSTLRPPTRPSSERQGPRGRAPQRDGIGSSERTYRADNQGNSQLRRSRQFTDLARRGRANLSERHPDIGASATGTPPIPIDQTERQLAAGPAGAARNARRVSFMLSADKLPSPSKEPRRHSDKAAGSSSSNKPSSFLNKPSKIPKPASPCSNRPEGGTSGNKTLSSAGRVSSLAHSGEAPPESERCPPAVLRDFKVRGARIRRDENVAAQSLKHVVRRDDGSSSGAPEGTFPNLRRIVSDFTEVSNDPKGT